MRIFAGDLSKSRQFAKEMKVAKTMLMIIGSFVICWLPYTIRIFVEFVTNENHFLQDKLYDIYGEHGKYYGKLVRSLVYHLTLLNSVFDPLIYFFRMREIRHAVKVLFCGRENLSSPSMKLSSSTKTSVISRHFRRTSSALGQD